MLAARKKRISLKKKEEQPWNHPLFSILPKSYSHPTQAADQNLPSLSVFIEVALVLPSENSLMLVNGQMDLVGKREYYNSGLYKYSFNLNHSKFCCSPHTSTTPVHYAVLYIILHASFYRLSYYILLTFYMVYTTKNQTVSKISLLKNSFTKNSKSVIIYSPNLYKGEAFS